MKGSSDIVSAIQHIRMADDHLQSFINEHPGSRGAKLFSDYRKKIAWILRDIKSHPFLPEKVIAGLRNEIDSDVFAVPAISEKIALVPPDKREKLEAIIDAVLNGEELNVEYSN